MKLQVPFGETLSVELDQYCSHYGLQDSEIHPTHNEVISIRSRKQNQPTQSNLAKLRSIVWLKMMISSFSVKFPTLIKNPCPSLGSMFFGGFVVHLHVGCTMKNTIRFSLVYPNLNLAIRRNVFFLQKHWGWVIREELAWLMYWQHHK